MTTCLRSSKLSSAPKKGEDHYQQISQLMVGQVADWANLPAFFQGEASSAATKGSAAPATKEQSAAALLAMQSPKPIPEEGA